MFYYYAVMLLYKITICYGCYSTCRHCTTPSKRIRLATLHSDTTPFDCPTHKPTRTATGELACSHGCLTEINLSHDNTSPLYDNDDIEVDIQLHRSCTSVGLDIIQHSCDWNKQEKIMQCYITCKKANCNSNEIFDLFRKIPLTSIFPTCIACLTAMDKDGVISYDTCSLKDKQTLVAICNGRCYSLVILELNGNIRKENGCLNDNNAYIMKNSFGIAIINGLIKYTLCEPLYQSSCNTNLNMNFSNIIHYIKRMNIQNELQFIKKLPICLSCYSKRGYLNKVTNCEKGIASNRLNVVTCRTRCLASFSVVDDVVITKRGCKDHLEHLWSGNETNNLPSKINNYYQCNDCFLQCTPRIGVSCNSDHFQRNSEVDNQNTKLEQIVIENVYQMNNDYLPENANSNRSKTIKFMKNSLEYINPSTIGTINDDGMDYKELKDELSQRNSFFLEATNIKRKNTKEKYSNSIKTHKNIDMPGLTYLEDIRCASECKENESLTKPKKRTIKTIIKTLEKVKKKLTIGKDTKKEKENENQEIDDTKDFIKKKEEEIKEINIEKETLVAENEKLNKLITEESEQIEPFKRESYLEKWKYSMKANKIKIKKIEDTIEYERKTKENIANIDKLNEKMKKILLKQDVEIEIYDVQQLVEKEKIELEKNKKELLILMGEDKPNKFVSYKNQDFYKMKIQKVESEKFNINLDYEKFQSDLTFELEHIIEDITVSKNKLKNTIKSIDPIESKQLNIEKDNLNELLEKKSLIYLKLNELQDETKNKLLLNSWDMIEAKEKDYIYDKIKRYETSIKKLTDDEYDNSKEILKLKTQLKDYKDEIKLKLDKRKEKDLVKINKKSDELKLKINELNDELQITNDDILIDIYVNKIEKNHITVESYELETKEIEEKYVAQVIAYKLDSTYADGAYVESHIKALKENKLARQEIEDRYKNLKKEILIRENEYQLNTDHDKIIGSLLLDKNIAKQVYDGMDENVLNIVKENQQKEIDRIDNLINDNKEKYDVLLNKNERGEYFGKKHKLIMSGIIQLSEEAWVSERNAFKNIRTLKHKQNKHEVDRLNYDNARNKLNLDLKKTATSVSLLRNGRQKYRFFYDRWDKINSLRKRKYLLGIKTKNWKYAFSTGIVALAASLGGIYVYNASKKTYQEPHINDYQVPRDIVNENNTINHGQKIRDNITTIGINPENYYDGEEKDKIEEEEAEENTEVANTTITTEEYFSNKEENKNRINNEERVQREKRLYILAACVLISLSVGIHMISSRNKNSKNENLSVQNSKNLSIQNSKNLSIQNSKNLAVQNSNNILEQIPKEEKKKSGKKKSKKKSKKHDHATIELITEDDKKISTESISPASETNKMPSNVESININDSM